MRISMRAIISLAALLFLALWLTLPGMTATEEQPAEQMPPPSRSSGKEIVFQGKLYSSLKRMVPVPYKGIVTDLKVQAGQLVREGDVLMSYRLAAEVIAKLRRSISPQALGDLEVRIANINGSLAPLRTKQKELQHLAQQRMASGQNLTQINLEIESLVRQREALEEQLVVLKRSAQDDINALRETLGTEVSFDHIPEEIQLTSPIDGHVLWIHPDIRVGSEMPAGEGLVVGVMDPMIIRANVFEIEASRLSIGDKATVSLASIPDKTFDATLSRISWTPVTPGLGQPSYYEVELLAPNPDFVLKEGYKTQATITSSK